MKLKPQGDRVVVLVEEAPTVSRGGIHLPERSRRNTQMGKILAVGPGRKGENGERIPLDLRVGDKVAFTRHAGDTVPELGDNIIILPEREILAVVEEAVKHTPLQHAIDYNEAFPSAEDLE
jgi:chaperonin GroES